ncbi:hypothetical protein ES708_20881 [subsurface metagenome]
MLITLISFLVVMFVLSLVSAFIIGDAPVAPFKFNRQTGAKLVLSPLVTSIRGKLGNGIAQVWRGIQTIRQMPKVISNPQSNAQAGTRGNLGSTYAAWLALTDPQKATWDEMAEQIADYEMPPAGVNNLVPGLGGKMSGFNCFVSFAMACVSAGLGFPTDAPLAEQRPGVPTSVQAAYATPTLTVTWADPAVVVTGGKIRIWLRSRMGIYHKQLVLGYALATQTADLTGARGALGKTIAFAVPEVAGNEELTIQLDTVNPTGLRSMGSAIVFEKLD